MIWDGLMLMWRLCSAIQSGLNMIWDMIWHTPLHWLEQNINQCLSSQKTPISRPRGRAMGCILWIFFRKRWLRYNGTHYSDVIMNTIGFQITSPTDCLLSPFFRRRSKKTSKLRVTGLCVGNSPVAGEFPAQMASNAENVSIWWRHHDLSYLPGAGLISVGSTSTLSQSC